MMWSPKFPSSRTFLTWRPNQRRCQQPQDSLIIFYQFCQRGCASQDSVSSLVILSLIFLSSQVLWESLEPSHHLDDHRAPTISSAGTSGASGDIVQEYDHHLAAVNRWHHCPLYVSRLSWLLYYRNGCKIEVYKCTRNIMICPTPSTPTRNRPELLQLTWKCPSPAQVYIGNDKKLGSRRKPWRVCWRNSIIIRRPPSRTNSSKWNINN